MKAKSPGDGAKGTNRRVFRPGTIQPPAAYYDSARGCFWMHDSDGGYIQVNETGIKRLGRSKGISTTVAKGEFISPLDAWVIDVQMKHNVTYAGPLSG